VKKITAKLLTTVLDRTENPEDTESTEEKEKN
jgi:hypothetical protein